MTNIIHDLNILTNIPEKSLTKLSTLAITCIGDAVWEAKQAGEELAAIDIGIGILYLKISDPGNIKYHFEPADPLRRSTKNTLESNLNPLTPKLTTSLKNKFMDVYKEIC